MFDLKYIGIYAIEAVCIIVAVMLHEIAHGYAAYRLGDPTAKNAGRLTLNPAKHLDPFGSVILPLMMLVAGGPIFAYAKPVPYNPRYFKNLRRGELITALAGPISNFAQALVGAAFCRITQLVYDPSMAPGLIEVMNWIYTFWYYYVNINLVLMFFNLIPLPPLDGASIVAVFLNQKQMMTFYKIKQYSMFILLLVLWGLPMILHWSPLSWYLQHTAGALLNILV